MMSETKSHSGFSLLEMAVVMLILGLLLGGLFSAVGDSTQLKRRSDATAQIKLIEEALYGFAQATGDCHARQPMPASVRNSQSEVAPARHSTDSCRH